MDEMCTTQCACVRLVLQADHAKYTAPDPHSVVVFIILSFLFLNRSNKVSGKMATRRARQPLVLDLQDVASATELLFETHGEGSVITVRLEASVDSATWVELSAALDVSPGASTAAKMLVHFTEGNGNATKVRRHWV